VNPRAFFQSDTGLKEKLSHVTLFSMQDMKMLFSSRNRAQIEKVRERLVAAGVRCEIRNFPIETPEAGTELYPELWIESNPDYHTASILYKSPVRVLQQQATGRTAYS
jgi:hypothetical protein